MKKSHTQKICICAILAALFVPLEWLASNFGKIAFLDSYQIPISCFPLILASVLFGVKWGFATAFVGSFVSQLALGYGITWSTFLWMVPTVTYALSVALLYRAFGKSDKTLFLAIELFISSLILSVFNVCVLYIDSRIFGYPYDFLNGFFKIIMSLKLVGGIVFAVIFALIVPPVIKKIKSIINK